jgi:hypothetical protein
MSRTLRLLTPLALFFAAALVAAPLAWGQQTLFSENFSDESVGDVQGTDNSGNDVSWTSQKINATGSDNVFSVQDQQAVTGEGNGFEARDLDDGGSNFSDDCSSSANYGCGRWETNAITLNSPVDLSVQALTNGDNKGFESNDYFRVFYSTDGGNNFTRVAAIAGDEFENNPDQTVSESSIGASGDDFVLRVHMTTNGGESITLDNVNVTESPPKPTSR